MSKDTPKYSKATQKNPREQGCKLLKENGSEDFRKCQKKSASERQAKTKKIALAQKI